MIFSMAPGSRRGTSHPVASGVPGRNIEAAGIDVGSFGEHVYKIGMTRRLEPHDRVRELGDASVPFSFDVHAMIPSQDAPALEHALHKRFVRSQMNKVNPRKEFFRLSLQEVRARPRDDARMSLMVLALAQQPARLPKPLKR